MHLIDLVNAQTPNLGVFLLNAQKRRLHQGSLKLMLQMAHNHYQGLECEGHEFPSIRFLPCEECGIVFFKDAVLLLFMLLVHVEMILVKATDDAGR